MITLTIIFAILLANYVIKKENNVATKKNTIIVLIPGIILQAQFLICFLPLLLKKDNSDRLAGAIISLLNCIVMFIFANMIVQNKGALQIILAKLIFLIYFLILSSISILGIKNILGMVGLVECFILFIAYIISYLIFYLIYKKKNFVFKNSKLIIYYILILTLFIIFYNFIMLIYSVIKG